MPTQPAAAARVRRVRILLGLFVVGLVLSGLTAFALETELRLVASLVGIDPARPDPDASTLERWLARVTRGVVETNERHPFIAYGTDWLAFAHLVIALAFIGPLRRPADHVWVVTWGMLACVAVIPLALIAGEVRQIPWWWRLIDCSFGAIGIVPLWLARREMVKLGTGATA